MKIDVLPRQIILMATLPMPPSTNDLHKPVVRYKKARSILEEDRVYAGKRTDPSVIAYELQIRNLLNYPQPPWRIWQEPLTIRALRENPDIKLDFELREYFNTRRKNDIDNRVKALQDILSRHLGIDDDRIVSANQKKRVHKKFDPHIVVTLRVAEPTDIWQEQSDLEEVLEQLLNERKVDASFAESQTLFSRTAASR